MSMMESIITLIAALGFALAAGVVIGRGYKARPDDKLREAGALLEVEAALGRELCRAVTRLRDQGQFTGPNVRSSISWRFNLPKDGGRYHFRVMRLAAVDQEESI